MNAKKTTFIFGLVIALLVLVPSLNAVTITTTTKYQEHSNWCWDASCAMCFTNYGYNYSQCSIANYIFGRNDCCGVATFYWNHTCNQGGTVTDMRNTLSAGGVSSSSTSGLSWTSVVSQISTTRRPFIMCWYWTGGGGHAIVGSGYTTSGGQQIYMKDPWPGEGPSWQTYSYCYSAYDHTWGATVKCR